MTQAPALGVGACVYATRAGRREREGPSLTFQRVRVLGRRCAARYPRVALTITNEPGQAPYALVVTP